MKLGFCLFFVSMAVAPVTFAQETSPGVTDKLLKLGVSAPLSGPTKVAGEAIAHGAEAFIKKLNADGGVNGRKLELVTYDDGYEQDRSLIGVDKMIKQDKVFAFISQFGTPSVLAIAPLLEREGVPLIGPVAAANFSDPIRKNVFAVRTNTFHEAQELIDHAVKELGLKTFAVFYQDDSFGTSGVGAVDKALSKYSLKTMSKSAYKRNSVDVDEAVKTFMTDKPQAIFLQGVMPATGAFLKKLAAAGLHPLILAGTAGATSDLAKEAADLKLDFFAAIAMPPLADSKMDLIHSFVADMKSAGFTDMHPFAVESYFNTMVVVEAIRRAGKNLTRETFRQALEQFKDASLGGVKVSYTPQDHQGIKIPFLVKLQNGQFQSATSFK